MMVFRSREIVTMVVFLKKITGGITMTGMAITGVATGVVVTDQAEWAVTDMKTGLTGATGMTGTKGIMTAVAFITGMTAGIVFRLGFRYGV